MNLWQNLNPLQQGRWGKFGSQRSTGNVFAIESSLKELQESSDLLNAALGKSQKKNQLLGHVGRVWRISFFRSATDVKIACWSE